MLSPCFYRSTFQIDRMGFSFYTTYSTLILINTLDWCLLVNITRYLYYLFNLNRLLCIFNRLRITLLFLSNQLPSIYDWYCLKCRFGLLVDYFPCNHIYFLLLMLTIITHPFIFSSTTLLKLFVHSNNVAIYRVVFLVDIQCWILIGCCWWGLADYRISPHVSATVSDNIWVAIALWNWDTYTHTVINLINY